MKRAGSAVVGLLVLALVGCSGEQTTEPPASPPATAPPVKSSAPGSQSPTPASAHGEPVTVSSHCGVVSVLVDGRLWLADPPLGDHNPPPGWDENETEGHFVRRGTRGTFLGEGGQTAHFVRAPAGAANPNAGCE